MKPPTQAEILAKQAQQGGRVAPPVPQTIEETGLLPEAIVELLLKTLYSMGARTGQQLTGIVRLPFQLIDDCLHDLQQRQLIEVRSAAGHGRGGYLYDLTSNGRDRAREAMYANQYVGPAPVPLNQYRAWVEAQTIRNVHINQATIKQGFSHLVFDPQFIEQLGPAINSAKSMFLYGDSGNGKTDMAESIARMLGGHMYLPHAVDIEGQIMVVSDPVYHRPADETESTNGDDPTWLETNPEYDRRFNLVQRPVVFTGGELTLEQLDLQYDTYTKIYQAPFQVKANGGVLIIDDFGRQLVRPRDLLNRWIVPLEKRVDFLTLHTGHKFPVPFDCLLIFATNLDPTELTDEAFLRRIHYKIHVPSPSYSDYVQIFRRCCVARQIPFIAGRVAYIYRQYYERIPLAPRSCHPRDLLDHLCDNARYLDAEAELSIDLLDRACASYFLDMPEPGMAGEGEGMDFEEEFEAAFRSGLQAELEAEEASAGESDSSPDVDNRDDEPGVDPSPEA